MKARQHPRAATTLTTMESYKIVFMKLTYQQIGKPKARRTRHRKRGII